MPRFVFTYSELSWPLSLLGWRERVAPYGRTPDEIIQATVALSHAFWGHSGRPLPTPGAHGARLVAAGRAVGWLGYAVFLGFLLAGTFLEPAPATRLMTALPRVFRMLPAEMRVDAANLIVPALGILIILGGQRLMAAGERLSLAVPLDLAGTVVSGARAEEGQRLVRLAWLLGIAGAVVFAANLLLANQMPWLEQRPLIWFPVAACAMAAMIGAIFMYQRSEQVLAPSASERQAADPRRPILLLRSFHDEDLRILTVRDAGRDRHYAYERLEEAVGDQFAPYGPLIAIGKPGEALPLLGAARNYYTDAEWKSAITRWMDEARILLVVPGLTPGLGWELEAIQRRGHLGKLLVLLPPSTYERAGVMGRISRFLSRFQWEWDSARGRFVSVAERIGGQDDSLQRRWQVLLQAFANVPAFAALPQTVPNGLVALHLGADGGPSLVLGGSMETDYEWAIQCAVYGMLAHVGEEARTPPHALSGR